MKDENQRNQPGIKNKDERCFLTVSSPPHAEPPTLSAILKLSVLQSKFSKQKGLICCDEEPKGILYTVVCDTSIGTILQMLHCLC